MKAIEALPYFLQGYLLSQTKYTAPNSQSQLPNLANFDPSTLGPIIGSLADRFIPKSRPTKAEDLPTTFADSPDVKRKRITYGPFKLRASGSKKREGNFFSFDPQGTGWAYLATDFPNDVTVLNARMSITLPDGEKISNDRGVYNHHAFFYDISKPMRSNIECEGANSRMAMIPAINSIAGSSADSGDIKLDMTQRPGVGNYVNKGAKVLVMGDLVNYNNSTQEVYMTADLQYVEGKLKGILEQEVQLIPAGICESTKKKGIFGVLDALLVRPPAEKKFSIKGTGLQFKNDGKLFVLKGHMHDGGVNMAFNLNNKMVCDSKAVYKAGTVAPKSGGHGHGGMRRMIKRDGGGMLSDVTGCLLNMDVKKGDILSMEAAYDMEAHPGREHPDGGMSEAMALAVVVVGREIK